MIKKEQVNKKVSKIIAGVLETEGNADFYSKLSDFSSIGISSIDFIRVVVKIENEYGFEFDDEDLDAEKFKNIDDLSNFIVNMKLSNEAV